MTTLSPRVIEEPVMVTCPDVIVLLLPSIVIDAVPTVSIPVTRASPSTTKSSVNVVAVPTSNPLLAVTNPILSTLVTSS